MSEKTDDYTTAGKRPPVLNAVRNLKMAESTQAYVRGSTVKFYEWLDSSHAINLPEGPGIWICGDCHVGNLGPVANAKGHVALEIRDLDQTVIGNPVHDVIRLGLSLAMSARDSSLPGVTTARMIEQLMRGYERAFLRTRDPMAEMEKPDIVKVSMKQALTRSWKQLAKDRIGGVNPRIPLGRHFWPLKKSEKNAIADLFAGDGLDELKAALRPKGDGLPIEVLDAAYWVKGCSSLGLLRYAVLVKFEEENASAKNMYLIDIKEAIATAAPRFAGAGMPRDNAKRVVEGARQLSPHLGKRMAAARILDRSVFLRELSPHDLKIEINKFDSSEAMIAASYLGQIVGRAHARQMDSAARAAWRRELLGHRGKTLDAPSWLWLSVVDLIGMHERSYLEHCRRFAMGQ